MAKCSKFLPAFTLLNLHFFASFFNHCLQYFPRLLCPQWWWGVLPVLLCDPQRGDPGGEHAFPVSCKQPFRGWAADCWRRMQFWHSGRHHQGWLAWGTGSHKTAHLNCADFQSGCCKSDKIFNIFLVWAAKSGRSSERERWAAEKHGPHPAGEGAAWRREGESAEGVWARKRDLCPAEKRDPSKFILIRPASSMQIGIFNTPINLMKPNLHF